MYRRHHRFGADPFANPYDALAGYGNMGAEAILGGGHPFHFQADGSFGGGPAILGAEAILGADPDLAALFSGPSDYDALMGADPRAVLLARRAHAAGMAQGHAIASAQSGGAPTAAQVAAMKQAGGLVVTQKPNTFAGEQVLPISTSATVGIGLSDIAEARPQRTIRCDRFAVPSTLSPFFTISQLNVGQEPQFVATGVVDAEIFSQAAFGVELKGSTATLGTIISVGVTNIDTAAVHFFRAVIIGATVY